VTGYSGTPLAAKLGIKAGYALLVAGAPEHYPDLLAPLPDGVRRVDRPGPEVDLAHLFTASRVDLTERLREFRAGLPPTAVVWVSWPKKASGVPSEITEDTIREVALPLGFVDVKVCAVDEVWSGLKLVVRKELR
jgi:hypothetical protein